jgi:hypothetical protein
LGAVAFALADTAPAVNPDTASTTESLSVAIDVLANDIDPSGTFQSSTVQVTSPPSHGTALADPVTGAITYLPTAGFTGTDSFTYMVCDDQVNQFCGTASVSVSVSPQPTPAVPAPPAPPTVNNDAATTPQDTSVVVDVLANDGDSMATLDPGSLHLVSFPTSGVASVDPATGVAVYTPNAGFNGTDRFTYGVCDTQDPPQCGTATVTVVVGTVPAETPTPVPTSTPAPPPTVTPPPPPPTAIPSPPSTPSSVQQQGPTPLPPSAGTGEHVAAAATSGFPITAWGAIALLGISLVSFLAAHARRR